MRHFLFDRVALVTRLHRAGFGAAQALRLLVASTFLVCASTASGAEEAETRGATILLDIKGAIGPATAEYVHEGLREAARRGAKIVILRMDTPGGLDSAMREIIRDILDSAVPVAAYVSPSGARAASAGTYILYSSHLAAMAPSTHLGAATPIQMGIGARPGGDESEKSRASANPAEAKAVNDAAAYIRGLAELRGRNADWAEKAVRDAATLTAAEAHSQRVIEIIATDPPDLLRQAEGRIVKVRTREVTLETDGSPIVEVAPSWRNRLLATVTDPTIAYLMLLVGLYGLLFEFLNPGAVVPGVVGGVSLLIALYALNLLPISYAGAALLLLGVALMIAEAFLPSFGIVGIGGVAAFAFGSLLLFRGAPGFALSWPVVLVATTASVGFFALALAAAWRVHRRGAVIGEEALLGSTGEVLSWADGEGEVRVMGECWRAQSSSALVPRQHVRIVRRRELTLQVEPTPEQ